MSPDAMQAALRGHVEALQEPREWRFTPDALARAEGYVSEEMWKAGLAVRLEGFKFRGRKFSNVVGSLNVTGGNRSVTRESEGVTGGNESADGNEKGTRRLVLGAHLDTVPGSPGADDNASGLAGLLMAARALVADPPACSVDFVAFHLEEFQKTTYRVGSRRFMAKARRDGCRYGGAFVFDMIGYASSQPGSQIVPRILANRGIPDAGNFIAVVGDRKGRFLVDAFSAAGEAEDLAVYPLVVPAKGWIVWVTRRSDNASFWDRGVPAVLISDTANLRNPHYHRPSDLSKTLNYRFMAQVVTSTIAAIRTAADVVSSRRPL